MLSENFLGESGEKENGEKENLTKWLDHIHQNMKRKVRKLQNQRYAIGFNRTGKILAIIKLERHCALIGLLGWERIH